MIITPAIRSSRASPAFPECLQARGFVIDPVRGGRLDCLPAVTGAVDDTSGDMDAASAGEARVSEATLDALSCAVASLEPAIAVDGVNLPAWDHADPSDCDGTQARGATGDC